MSFMKEESDDKNVGVISMQDFLHFLKVCIRRFNLSGFNDFLIHAI